MHGLKITALFTGLLRTPEDFLSKLEILISWREGGVIDAIMISTWIGELDLVPGLHDRLISLGISIVETQEPKLKWRAHLFHQMKALHYGLMAIEKNSIVFKLRSDKMALTNEIRDLILAIRNGEIDMATRPPQGWPTDWLQYRIWSPIMIPSRPFFFNDILFLGLREDLLKMICMDISLDMFFPRINPEQIFFSKPFLQFLPLIFQYYRVNPGLVYHSEVTARALDVACAEDIFIRKVIFTSLVVANGYFRIGFPVKGQAVKDSNFLWSDIFTERCGMSRSLVFRSGANTIHMINDKHLPQWLEQIQIEWRSSCLTKGLGEYCLDWNSQSAYDYETISFSDEMLAFISVHDQLGDLKLLYPNALSKGNYIRLPWWPIKISDV